MNKRVLWGGLAGGGVILAFAFSILLIVNSAFPGFATGSNVWASLFPMLLAPVAGGFLAGLIGKPDPQRAGLIAGVIAGLGVFVAWLVVMGVSGETVLRGLVIVLIWVALARGMAGFAQPRKKA